MSFEISAMKTVVAASKLADEKKLLNAYEGNVSVRCGDYIYITPSGKSKALLTEEMIAVIDMNGNQVGGCFKASTEMKLHLHTYRIRPDIMGIIHAHTPVLTAHALCRMPVSSKAYPEATVIFGTIEVAAYGRPGSDDVYKEVGQKLEDTDVVLLANHGAMAVGPTVFDALNNLEAAEKTAKILMLAKALGAPVDLPDDEIAALYAQHEARRGKA